MTDLASASFSSHAMIQMERRGISEAQVREVLARPERVVHVREGRIVVQGIVASPISRSPYLLRVFVDVDQEPPVVVTAYKTSKWEKYGSRP